MDRGECFYERRENLGGTNSTEKSLRVSSSAGRLGPTYKQNGSNHPLMAPLFLGLDLSTQQLKAVIISEDATVVHEFAVHFDNDLPQYKTTNGAILGPAEGEV